MFKVKSVWWLPVLSLSTILSNCKVQKKPDRAEFEFPAAMKDYVKADFQKQCVKGEVLYDLHCSGCHNVKAKRKMVVPDFTTAQVLSYDMRLANKAHQSNLDSEQVTTEELGYIISFLSYKKKIGVPAIIGEENHSK